MNSNQKGTIAEVAVAAAAVKKGYMASKPLGDCPYDLIIDKNGKLYRVQIKYRTLTKGAIIAKFDDPHSTTYSGTYNAENVDAMVLYESTTGTILWLPISLATACNGMTIRFEKPKNGQSKGVHLVNDFVEW